MAFWGVLSVSILLQAALATRAAIAMMKYFFIML
jgi:hypothetical protein